MQNNYPRSKFKTHVEQAISVDISCSMDVGNNMDGVDSAPSSSEHSILPLRTLEEVTQSAEAAGLSDSSGPVQLLHFSSQLHSEDVRLMEMEEPVLAALRRGEKIVIRGMPEDDAVLCTNDKTFDLRVADTSNTLLIVPSLACPTQTKDISLRPCEVTAYLGSYLELRPCRPRVERLKDLLSEWPFRGPEYEINATEVESQDLEAESAPLRMRGGEERGKKRHIPRKYAFEDLLGLVQASEEELYMALDKLQACPILGYWRCLDADYRDQAVEHIMTLLEEQDWSYKRVPLNATCELLKELVPEFIVKHCFSCYGDQLEEDGGEGEIYYQMVEVKVCQFYAELLLRPAGKFSYEEFLTSWQQTVPEGMQTSLDQLKGLALTEPNSAPPVIWYFSAADLPQAPLARFLRLFEVKEKWTFEEIEPYIRDLETPKQSLNALLMKFSRVSTDTARGLKLYSSKRTS